MRLLTLTAAALAGLFLLALSAGQAGPPAEPPPIEVVKQQTLDGVTVTDLWYWSDGLKIAGLVCRPVGSGELPTILYEHGGFDGLTGRNACVQAAREGFVFGASAFRGQSGSEGTPEACMSEVDDALEMLEVMAWHYGADRKRVGHVGVSLGGCVALRAAQRDPGSKAAAVFGAVTDFAFEVTYLRGAGRGPALERWYSYIGGTPENAPAAYDARGSLADAAALPVPLLVMHGGNDPVVPFALSCRLRDARREAGRTVRQELAGPSGEAWTGTLPIRNLCFGKPDEGGIPATWGQEDHYLAFPPLEHDTKPAVTAAWLSFMREQVE